MDTDRILCRWVELASGVLGSRSDLAVPAEMWRALAEDFRAVGAGMIEAVPPPWASPDPSGRVRGVSVDLRYYTECIVTSPLLRHYLANPQDVVVHAAQEVAALALPVLEEAGDEAFGRMRADGLAECLAFPLPAYPGGGPRWFVLARDDRYSAQELAMARLLHPLLIGLERHVALAFSLSRGLVRSVEHQRLDAGEGAPGTEALTQRELSVLRLMADGLIARAIADRLGVSPHTVAKHQERIYRKLDTSDRLSAVLRAQAVGLIQPQAAALDVHSVYQRTGA